MPLPAQRAIPPSLSHFVIFNPTLKLAQPVNSPGATGEEVERDRDEEDDLKEAAQIMFYTSRQAGGVSRDKMLRQVGLVKGLMGFIDMVATEVGADYWSIRSHKSRLLIWSPEPDFYVYVNITLAQTATEASPDGKVTASVAPASTAQGLSDGLLIDALRRGYEDFRFLHGPFQQLVPSSQSSLSLLERYWTRFAFSYENDHLSSPSQTANPLADWFSGYPPKSKTQTAAVDRAVEGYLMEASVMSGTQIGVITKDGPVGSGSEDDALHRFLVGLVRASLPPAVESVSHKSDVRHSLGIGRSKKTGDARASSWASFGNSAVSWVPSFGVPSRSSTPTAGDKEKAIPPTTDTSSIASDTSIQKKPKGGWGMGLNHIGGAFAGVGDAMGSVGTVFGLGSTKTGAAPQVASSQTIGEVSTGKKVEDVGNAELSTSQETDTAVQDVVISTQGEEAELPDLLAAARSEEQAELSWEKRNVFVRGDSTNEFVKRRLTWTIRENVLLYLLHPGDVNEVSQPPSSQSTHKLFAKLRPRLSPDRRSTDSSRPSPNPPSTSNDASVFSSGKNVDVIGQMDFTASAALTDLKDLLQNDLALKEIYARTPNSKFIAAKRMRTSSTGDNVGEDGKSTELYMSVGKKDTSLTDADYAVRAFLRERLSST